MMTISDMPKEARDTLLAQLKGKNLGILLVAVLAAVAPAWTGAINSFDTKEVDQAHEKVDYSYKLLSKKSRLEKEAMVDKLKQQDKRIDRLENKIDTLLMIMKGEVGEKPPIIHESPPPSVKIAEALELPENLEEAMEQKTL